MFVDSIGIKGFKSIGPRGVELEDLQKINILIGKNNAGKSNILRFIDFLGKNDIRGGKINVPFGEYDYHSFDPQNPAEFTLRFEIEKESDLSQVIDDSVFETKYRIAGTGQGSTFELADSSVHHVHIDKIREYVQSVRGISGGNDSDRLNDALGHLRVDSRFSKPPILLLNEFRTLDKNAELTNAIDELINHDSREQRQKKPIIDNLTSFITSIIGRQVTIRYPRSKVIELVLDGGDSMPISSLGTGLHEIVIMAFYLATSQPSIVCIDEPELHLHPETQRAFLRFISENTNHQYFIATHSNSFLDPDINTSIYRVYTDDFESKTQTAVEKCDDIQKKRDVLEDLGVRASEILQTNGIIWVEGPSDRNYVSAWLKLVDQNLKEGFDYTFQYYGGALLAGFTIGDSEFNDFIDMLLINRNSYVIMDSDMSSRFTEAQLAARKKKIIKGCKSNSLGYWVTSGREIENYLNEELLQRVYGQKVSPKQFSKIKSYCRSFDDQHKATESKKLLYKFNTRILRII